MHRSKIGLGLLAGAAVTLGAAGVWSAAPPGGWDKPDGAGRISVAEARERARLMHRIHSATLEALHQHYFPLEGAVIPARAMEDVFEEVNKEEKVLTRWIAVNALPMSAYHKPKTEIEKEAAAALASGKPAFERVEKGTYHRAGAIPLGHRCAGCHTRFGAPPTRTPPVAGLMISMPVRGE
jgi:hypothetical protein